MTEREIEARLRNERISLPDGFEARQEAALRRVMAKRECVLPKRMAWLVAALALMMSAAAIAAGGRGLAFFWRQATGVPSVMGTPGFSGCGSSGGGSWVPGVSGAAGGCRGILPSGGAMRVLFACGAAAVPMSWWWPCSGHRISGPA